MWQDTALDLASLYVWTELAMTPLNPSARMTSDLVRRVERRLNSRFQSRSPPRREVPVSAAGERVRRVVVAMRRRMAGRDETVDQRCVLHVEGMI